MTAIPLNARIKMPEGFHRWTCCDDIMVLDLYFKAGRQQLPQWDDGVIELSEIIGTTPVSVNRKMANYQWLDPLRQGGLSSASAQSRRVWSKFARNERRLRATAYKCRRGVAESLNEVTVKPADKDADNLDRIIGAIRSDPKLSPENAEILADIVKTYYLRLASH